MESKVRDEICREGRGGGGRRLMGKCYLGLGNILFIVVFFKWWLVEPVRFGSVQSVSDFKNRNRTEPNQNFFVIF